jgi:hypothetical protein
MNIKVIIKVSLSYLEGEEDIIRHINCNLNCACRLRDIKDIIHSITDKIMNEK